jgi:mannobiose 2-epimerase
MRIGSHRSSALFLRFFLLFSLPTVAGAVSHAAQPTVHDPAQNRPTAKTYRRLADEVEKHFRSEVLARWFPRCVDKNHGGFAPHFLEDWSKGSENDKTIVFQARTTWVCAQVAMRYPELKADYLGYTRHGMDFLEKVMWDEKEGGFFWGLDETGKIKPDTGAEKHAYGIAFALYGLSAAYETTGDSRALDLARRTFTWLDGHAHDPAHGGYFEALARSGEPILSSPRAGTGPANSRAADLIGTAYGYKSMNSHIHLLEAMTALDHVWPDPRVQMRLRELFDLVRDKIAVEPGCLNLFFTPDWRPVPDHDSFGHDIETAYLLLEAAAALKQPDDAKTLTVAKSLVDHALLWGWDERLGGFYDKGAAFTPACGREKIWWTQAEGLNALLLMHAHFGGQSPRYFDAFLKQWDFIGNYQADHQHGEWYETVSAEGPPRPGEAKGTVWKAAYHNGRALMNVSETLRRLAR